MYSLLRALWQDEAGFIVSAELVMIGTVLVVGLITGMACLQDAMIGEYTEVAGALRGLDQSYSASGMHGCWDRCCGVTSWTAGSAYYQNGVERQVCFGMCPPGPVVCPPVVVPPGTPAVPVPETPPIAPCPCDSTVPAVPVPDGAAIPCPCQPAATVPVPEVPTPIPNESAPAADPVPEFGTAPPSEATPAIPQGEGVFVPPPPFAAVVPIVPTVSPPVGPRKCSCTKTDCPPDGRGGCPQPTVFPLPGPFVW